MVRLLVIQQLLTIKLNDFVDRIKKWKVRTNIEVEQVQNMMEEQRKEMKKQVPVELEEVSEVINF